MVGYYLMLAVMVTFVTVLALIDWLERRKNKQSRDRAA